MWLAVIVHRYIYLDVYNIYICIKICARIQFFPGGTLVQKVHVLCSRRCSFGDHRQTPGADFGKDIGRHYSPGSLLNGNFCD